MKILIFIYVLLCVTVFSDSTTKLKDISFSAGTLCIDADLLSKDDIVKIPMMNEKKITYDVKRAVFLPREKYITVDTDLFHSIDIFQKGIDIVRIVLYLKQSYTELEDTITLTSKGICISFSQKKDVLEYIPVVVIDPGHGGKDPGAVSGDVYEKDLALTVSRKLADKLNSFVNVKAFLTRTSDYFIPLKERIKIAKEMFADVFISVHLDSVNTDNCSGFGIYYLSKNGATSAAAKNLAEKENSADLIGGVSRSESFEIYSILMDLEQTNTIKQSSVMAGMLKNELSKNNVKVHTVSQAEFAVLKSFNIPSALLELGFISSKKERALLQSKKYQNKLVEIISYSIYNYLINEYIPSKKFYKLTKDGTNNNRKEQNFKRSIQKDKKTKFISY